MPKKIKKKVIKQKQKQAQRQSVKININQPVKRVYSKSKPKIQQPMFPSIFPSQPIVNVSIPNLERNYESILQEIKKANILGQPTRQQTMEMQTEPEEAIQEAIVQPLPKLRSRKSQTKEQKEQRKLIIEEDEPAEIRPSRIPRLQPTIAELKEKYIFYTGDKEAAKSINKTNKTKFIELIKQFESTGNAP